MKQSVFKVERKSITMDVCLSDGSEGTISVVLPNTKQVQELLRAAEAGASASMDCQVVLLNTNVSGELKNAFIDDIMENGDVTEFFNVVQSLAATQKKPQ